MEKIEIEYESVRYLLTFDDEHILDTVVRKQRSETLLKSSRRDVQYFIRHQAELAFKKDVRKIRYCHNA